MPTPSIIVVDDFLSNPDAIREKALTAQFFTDETLFKGRRSVERFLDIVDPTVIGNLIGAKVDDWARHGMNTRFQLCTGEDPIVFHSDAQAWAGALYLVPGAPPEAGTSFHRSWETGARACPTDPELLRRTYDGKLLDPTKWELIDRVGNVYNRLVLWRGNMIHSASCYFGTGAAEDSRLIMLLFFDAVA